MLLKQWYFHQLRMSLFESEPCTLQSYHNVVCLLYIYLLSFVLIFCQEGGLDIVGEDNIHYKLATHVICVFSEQDALVAAPAEQHQQHHYTGFDYHHDDDVSSVARVARPRRAGRRG